MVFLGPVTPASAKHQIPTLSQNPQELKHFEMELKDAILIITAVSSLVNILAIIAGGIYVLAVVRENVKTLQSDSKNHYAHSNDATVHFNTKFFAEFEKRIDEKFLVVKHDMTKIEEKVDKVEAYCEEIDNKLDQRQ